KQLESILDLIEFHLFSRKAKSRRRQSAHEAGEQFDVLAELSPRVFRIGDAVVNWRAAESVVCRRERRRNADLVSVSIRGERKQPRVLRSPAESPNSRFTRSLQNRDLANESANSTVALICLLLRYPTQ